MSRTVHKLLSFRGSPLDQALLGHSVGGRSQIQLTESLSSFLVTDNLRAAFSRVDRKEFIPCTASPYMNAPVRVTPHHAVSSPQFHAQQLSIVADALVPDATCLDLGCGTGYLAAVMAEMGVRRVLAVEASEEMCDSASKNLRKYGSQVEVVLDKAMEVVGKSDPFNAIIVAPFFPSRSVVEQFIAQHLAVDGLACVAAATTGYFQQLYQGTKVHHTLESPDSSRVEIQELMQVACEALESRPSAPAAEKVNAERWLAEWRTAFEQREGRQPTMNDIKTDTVATAMFAAFSKSRKYDPRL